MPVSVAVGRSPERMRTPAPAAVYGTSRPFNGRSMITAPVASVWRPSVSAASVVFDETAGLRKSVLPVAMRAFHIGVKLARVASMPFSAVSVIFHVSPVESIANSALTIGVNRRLRRAPILGPRRRSRLAAVSTGSSGVTLVARGTRSDEAGRQSG